MEKPKYQQTLFRCLNSKNISTELQSTSTNRKTRPHDTHKRLFATISRFRILQPFDSGGQSSMVNLNTHMSSGPCRKSGRKALLRRISHCFCIQPEASPSESESQDIVNRKTYFTETSCYTSTNETEKAASGRGDVLTNEVHETGSTNYIPVEAGTSSPSVSKTSRINLRAVYNLQETQNNNVIIDVGPSNTPPAILKYSLKNHVSIRGDDQICPKGDTNTTIKVSNDNPGKSASISTQPSMRIDSILYAANEVATASQLLSNAITVLKQHVCAEHIQKVKDRGLNYAGVPVSEHCSTEVLLDIPPLSYRRLMRRDATENKERVFHYATQNVRIYIEDMNPMEPVRKASPATDKPSLEYLAPNKTDKPGKSRCPTFCGPRSFIRNQPYLQEQSSIVQNCAAPQETCSNCKTLLTNTFKPFSTEETQVTEVDDDLTTDESDSSGMGNKMEQNPYPPSSCSLPSFKRIISLADRCNANSIESDCVELHTPSHGADQPTYPLIEACTRDVRHSNLNNSTSSHEEHAPTTEFVIESWEYERDTSVGYDHHIPVDVKMVAGCCLEPNPTKSAAINPKVQEGLTSVQGQSTTDPNLVTPDCDELSFEVLYQRNNHNQKLVVDKANPGESFSPSLKKKNYEFLTHEFIGGQTEEIGLSLSESYVEGSCIGRKWRSLIGIDQPNFQVNHAVKVFISRTRSTSILKACSFSLNHKENCQYTTDSGRPDNIIMRNYATNERQPNLRTPILDSENRNLHIEELNGPTVTHMQSMHFLNGHSMPIQDLSDNTSAFRTQLRYATHNVDVRSSLLGEEIRGIVDDIYETILEQINSLVGSSDSDMNRNMPNSGPHSGDVFFDSNELSTAALSEAGGLSTRRAVSTPDVLIGQPRHGSLNRP